MKNTNVMFKDQLLGRQILIENDAQDTVGEYAYPVQRIRANLTYKKEIRKRI